MTEQVGFALRGRNPDVLTCIANLSNDEVFTPPDFANRMLDAVAKIAAACWCAVCVQQPQMTNMIRANFAPSHSLALRALYVRCLVMSREIGDPDLTIAGPLDQAREVLTEDPLDEPSGVSA